MKEKWVRKRLFRDSKIKKIACFSICCAISGCEHEIQRNTRNGLRQRESAEEEQRAIEERKEKKKR